MNLTAITSVDSPILKYFVYDFDSYRFKLLLSHIVTCVFVHFTFTFL